jgi:hypothetical protein
MRESVTWTSSQGVQFNFVIFDPRATWPCQAGLYLFCRFDPGTRMYQPLYIGQCNDFSVRLGAHERWAEALRAGATHVLLVSVDRQGDRDKLEGILIRELQPGLNCMLR